MPERDELRLLVERNVHGRRASTRGSKRAQRVLPSRTSTGPASSTSATRVRRTSGTRRSLISKDDPNGTYTVETIASNVTGGQSVSWFSFMVIPFFQLAIDFSSLSFANNGANQYGVSGDTTWAPPTSSAPTVTNGGNSGEQIGVAFPKLSYTPAGAALCTFRSSTPTSATSRATC